MPRGDGTGPRGIGTMTGRGAGKCIGGQNRGKVKNGSGNGAAGRGICNRFNASDPAGKPAQETENRLLMEQADALRRELDEIDNKLNSLQKKN